MKIPLLNIVSQFPGHQLLILPQTTTLCMQSLHGQTNSQYGLNHEIYTNCISFSRCLVRCRNEADCAVPRSNVVAMPLIAS